MLGFTLQPAVTGRSDTLHVMHLVAHSLLHLAPLLLLVPDA